MTDAAERSLLARLFVLAMVAVTVLSPMASAVGPVGTASASDGVHYVTDSGFEIEDTSGGSPLASFPDDNTLDLPGITLSSTGSSFVTLDQRTGTFTNLTNVDDDPDVAVDPDDKQEVTLMGGLDSLNFSDANYTAANASVDLVYSASSQATLRFESTGLPTGETVEATDVDSDTVLDTTTVQSNGSITVSGLSTGTHSVNLATVAPSISSFDASNPSGQDVTVSFDSDKQLPAISVSISGAESDTLTEGDFTETDNGGSYTYEATYSGSTGGDYTATLDTAEDAVGNDGSGSESETVTVDTDLPGISSFDASNPSGQDVSISFDSDEQLSIISVSLSGAESATLTESDFTETDNGGSYTYETTYSGLSDGDYTVTLDTAEDDGGNDGSGDLSDTVTVDTTAPSISSFSADSASGQDVTVSFDSNEQLLSISVSISGAETGTLTEGDFSETDTGGSYTYEATYSGSSDGDYTATLDTAADDVGNDGSSSESDTVVVDTTVPTADAGSDTTVTVGQSVRFDGGSSTDNIGVTSYEWAFADGTTTTGVSPTRSYTSPGQYSVTLTVADAAGNTDTDTVAVTVEDRTDPTAVAGRDITVQTGEQIRLDGSESSDNVDITSYQWDFGDGSGANGNLVRHSYDTPGTYTATLIVTDAAGNSDRDSVTVTVESGDTEAPTAEAGPDRTIDTGDSVSFDATNSSDNVDITSYEWAFGDGTDSTGARVTHTYDSPGTYTATLTVEDAAGNTDTDTLTVVVGTLAPSISSFSVGNPAGQNVVVSFDSDEQLSTIRVPIRGAESATLTASAFTEIDTGDGNYTYEATYDGSTDGDYTATLDTAADADGNDGASGQSDTVTVDTSVPTVSSFDVTNPSGQNVSVAFESDTQLSTIGVSLSGAESATLTASAFTEIVTGDGNYTYEATYSGSTDGDYTATLDTAEDAGGNDGASGQSDTVTVDTTPPTITTFETTVSNGTIQVTFDTDESASTISVAIGGNESATLTAGDFTESGGTYTGTYTPAADGNYTVTLETVADAAGNDGASGQSQNVTVDTGGTDPPVAEAGSDVTVTNGTAVSFDGSDSTDDTGIDSYEWAFGDGTPATGSTATHTYDSPGTYTATLTVTDSDGNTASDTLTVTVEAETPPPTVDVFELQNPTGSTVEVTVGTDQQLGTLQISLSGPESATLTLADATESTEGSSHYTYTASYVTGTDGDYTATLQSAVNAEGDDGADGQSASVTVQSSDQDDGDTGDGDTGDGDDGTDDGDGDTGDGDTGDGDDGTDDGDTGDGDTGDGDDGTDDGDGDTGDGDDGTDDGDTGDGDDGTDDSDGDDGDGTPGGKGNLTVTPRSVDFGSPRIDEQTTRTFTIENIGSGDETVPQITIGGADAASFAVAETPAGTTLAPGETVGFTVAYTGAVLAAGTEATARLSLTDADDGFVGLSASPQYPRADVSGESLNFGNLTVGESAQRTVTVGNPEDGDVPLTIEGFSIVGSDRDAFSTNYSGESVELDPGEERMFDVTLTPESTGQKTAFLQLRTNSPTTPQINVWLSNLETVILVNEVTDQNATQADSDDTASGSPARVDVEGIRVQSRMDVSVNTSAPSTRERPASIDALDMRYADEPNFTMSLRHYEDNPSTSAPDYSVGNASESLHYVEINHTFENEAVENTTFEVRLNQSTLAPLEASAENVSVGRYHDGSWETVPVEVRSIGERTARLQVRPPGFSLFSVAVPQPSFSVSSLAVADSPVSVGDSTTVNATITNGGDLRGTYTATLSRNGTVVETRELTLGPGETTDLSIEQTLSDPGAYTFEMANQSVDLAVERADSQASDDDSELTVETTSPATTGAADESEDDGGNALVLVVVSLTVVVLLGLLVFLWSRRDDGEGNTA